MVPMSWIAVDGVTGWYRKPFSAPGWRPKSSSQWRTNTPSGLVLTLVRDSACEVVPQSSDISCSHVIGERENVLTLSISISNKLGKSSSPCAREPVESRSSKIRTRSRPPKVDMR